MIEDKVLESNVTVLRTPLVDIEIVDEDDHNISFDIVESWNSIHDVWIDNDENKIIEAENYDEKRIRIKTSSLEIRKVYFVKTSVPIESRGYDERQFTYGYTRGTQTFAMTFPDPNELAKQLPDEFGDEWEWYDFNAEEATGTKAISFYLIDRKKDYINIPVAWIWNIHDHMVDYEAAVVSFTWTI